MVLRQTSPVMVHGYAIGAVDVKKQEVREKLRDKTGGCARD